MSLKFFSILFCHQFYKLMFLCTMTLSCKMHFDMYSSCHNQFNCLPVKVPWLTSPLWGWWHFCILSDSSLLMLPHPPTGHLNRAYGEYRWVFRNSQGVRGTGWISSWRFSSGKIKLTACHLPNMTFYKTIMIKLTRFLCNCKTQRPKHF